MKGKEKVRHFTKVKRTKSIEAPMG